MGVPKIHRQSAPPQMKESVQNYAGTRFLLSLAIGGTAVIICTTLIICGSLFRDINALYDEISADLDEFKVRFKFFCDFYVRNFTF